MTFLEALATGKPIRCYEAEKSTADVKNYGPYIVVTEVIEHVTRPPSVIGVVLGSPVEFSRVRHPLKRIDTWEEVTLSVSDYLRDTWEPMS